MNAHPNETIRETNSPVEGNEKRNDSSLSDRELLELAAKAAGDGLFYQWTDAELGVLRYVGMRQWNPLEDDGDALRLAVRLGFCVGKAVQAPQRFACPQETDDAFYEEEGGDPFAATRRAIVLAAASLAK